MTDGPVMTVGLSIGPRRAQRSTPVACVLTSLIALTALLPEDASARFTKREATAAMRVAWSNWQSLRPQRFDTTGFACSLPGVQLEWVNDLGPAMATARIGGCALAPPTIVLEKPTVSRLSDIGACGVITHEFGHLLGYGHSPVRRRLMSGDSGPGIASPRRATWRRAWNWCRRSPALDP